MYFIFRLSGIQWASLFLLTSSVASIQIAKSGTNILVIPFLPAFLTVLSSGLAGCAGVIIEKLMKGKDECIHFPTEHVAKLVSLVNWIDK